MPDIKPSGLPADTSLDDNHYVILNDPAGPTTKRTTLGTLRTWLQSIAGWVTGSMLANQTVKSTQIDFTSIMKNATGSGGAVTTSNGSFSALAGTPTISFTLTNAATVNFVATAFVQGATAGTIDISSAVYDSTTIISHAAVFTSTAINNGSNVCITGSASLAAGAHTIQIRNMGSNTYAFFPTRSSIMAILSNV